MPTIALMTVGCKVNQYETEVLTELFRKEGYEIVPADAPAVADLFHGVRAVNHPVHVPPSLLGGKN